MPQYDPPLSGVQVLDLSSGPMAAVGRLLADLGAHVTHVRLRGITGDEPVGPVVGGVPVGTAIDRLGLGEVDLDPATGSGRLAWETLLADADVLIETTRPGSAAEAALGAAWVRERYPALVIASVSDFGRGHRYSGWQTTTPVLHALTSELSRSGLPGREPLLPPGELPYQVAAAQAAAMTVSMFLDRLRTGQGCRIDFSVLDGAMQALDPPFGMTGSASAGVPLSQLPRGRTDERFRYPIIGCADGYVRICVLSRRQWQCMFAWMGSPPEFADPKYDNLWERFNSPALLQAISRFFSDKEAAELEVQGQRHGVPTAAVLTLDQALVGPMNVLPPGALPSLSPRPWKPSRSRHADSCARRSSRRDCPQVSPPGSSKSTATAPARRPRPPTADVSACGRRRFSRGASGPARGVRWKASGCSTSG
jgi:crotonobetainyl-CoA:carnitine CoA-transferase CaiB-like acyl-CoA transferase